MHFCSSILGVCIFHHGVVKKAIKIFAPWQGIEKHYKKNIQFEHSHWPPKDL
jgi:hypothetical protein